MKDIFGDIYGFDKEHSFLSNFFYCDTPIIFNNINFTTVEHAYVASKTLDINTQKFISTIVFPNHAKKFGKQLDIRSDFDSIKVDLMYDFVFQKFSKNEELKIQLLSTESCYIEETNKWKDTFWGVCDGIGRNELGKILMNVRNKLTTL